jgi:translocation and assembly module TamB
VRVRRDARGQTTVRGTLDVTGGIISAQGQTLAIESGVVVYNGPIGNPYIDVRAVRKIEDQTPPVKVGLRIQGNANRLTSTIFSEPAMAENRALAFLVLGRDIDQESDADSGQLVAAAINLGLSQSKSLIGELQRATGLDELSAVAETQDSFAIAAGKRIGKDLYLRYTYNTLTAMGAILISFNLSERWRLEALSGENSAMDILYRISDRPLRR